MSQPKNWPEGVQYISTYVFERRVPTESRWPVHSTAVANDNVRIKLITGLFRIFFFCF